MGDVTARGERARCVRCGYCATEALNEDCPVMQDTGRRTFEHCDVCRDKTTHRVEEPVPLA